MGQELGTYCLQAEETLDIMRRQGIQAVGGLSSPSVSGQPSAVRVLQTAELATWTSDQTGRGCETRRFLNWCYCIPEKPGIWLTEYSWEVVGWG